MIAIGFAAVALLSIYGSRFVNHLLLGREHFAPLVPGEVNIVGINTKAGYAVLVQNRAAKLVIGETGQLGPGEMSDRALEESSSDKRFIPIREMLKGLKGDADALGVFVQRLNDIKDDDLPPYAPVWRIEDIQAAVAGKADLRAKLEHDINVTLDGKPLDSISRSALFNGILVDTPVPIDLQLGSERRRVMARVKRSYRPQLMGRVLSNLENKYVDAAGIAREYMLAVNDLKQGRFQPENVADSLLALGKSSDSLARFPQSVLNSVTPVVNEFQITTATYVTQQTPKGDAYTLRVQLNDEGRKRLWQFSNDRVGDQLLVTVNGIAIAAPRIAHPLSDGEIEVTGLQDESLAKLAVDTINKRATKP